MKTIITKRGLKFLIREGTTDEKVVKEVVERNVYTKTGLLQISAGETWLDLGANIGTFSVLCASLGAKVVAFEPEDNNYLLLNNNIKSNSLSVTTIKKAVTTRIGKINLYICSGEYNKYRHTTKPTRGREVVQIESLAFEDVLRTYKPQGIKMDIEGSELSIFDSLPKMTGVNKITFEYHFDHDYSVANFHRRMRFLEDLGFALHYSPIPKTVLEYRFFPASKIVRAVRK